MSDATCPCVQQPERINPETNQKGYNVKSDIWSLGITMVSNRPPTLPSPSPGVVFFKSSSHLQIELAILRFPYDSWGTPFQQLKQVVEEPSPQLPAGQFSPEFVDFSSQWCDFLFPCCCSTGKDNHTHCQMDKVFRFSVFLCSLKKVSKERPTYAELMVSHSDDSD